MDRSEPRQEGRRSSGGLPREGRGGEEEAPDMVRSQACGGRVTEMLGRPPNY